MTRKEKGIIQSFIVLLFIAGFTIFAMEQCEKPKKREWRNEVYAPVKE